MPMVNLMPYLIDGHNLIGKLPDISLDDPDDEAKLVQKLIAFVARTGKKCVVVFDHGLPGGTSKMSTSGVRVVFASNNSNADRVMIDRIHKERNPRQWIVVSSDNEVLSNAMHRRMQTIKSAQFAILLRTAKPAPKPGREEAPDLRLSADEVDEWMQIFESDSND